MDIVSERPSAVSHFFFVVDNYARYILSKSLIIILTVHSFYTTWEVILFTTLEYPQLNQALANKQISHQELESILAETVVLVLSTIIGALLAIRLSTNQEKLANRLNIVVSVVLIIFHTQIKQYFLSLNLLSDILGYLPL